mgnify:CR=1 FL=1
MEERAEAFIIVPGGIGTFEEFFETARYFGEGKFSPIRTCKKIKGYSKAWIHHKNHNKHHYEYWYDYNADIPSPIMPYPYFVEMVCDSLAAGMIYQGKDWNQEYQMHYWLRVRENAKIHPKMDKLLTLIDKMLSQVGLYSLGCTISLEGAKLSFETMSGEKL